MPTHRVTLLPSQHQFLTSSKISLLHAGLESGQNLKFGCDGGNCGQCLSRLVSGDIQPVRHSDFVLSAEQKRNKHFLSCCYAANSDLQIEAVEIGNVQEIPEQFIAARVYKIQYLSEQVLSISFKTPRQQPLQFLAGQYVNIHFGNTSLSRNKSIASCPCDGLKPEIHVKKRPGDPFSEYVFNKLKKNDPVQIVGPVGDFVLDDDSNRPVLLIAFNTGFASIKSLIEHAIALEKEQPIKLYWILTQDNQPYLENYCRMISQALDNFSYQTQFMTDASAAQIEQSLEQVFEREKAAKYSDVYVTLPSQYRGVAEQILINLGIDDRHWRVDSVRKL